MSPTGALASASGRFALEVPGIQVVAEIDVEGKESCVGAPCLLDFVLLFDFPFYSMLCTCFL